MSPDCALVVSALVGMREYGVYDCDLMKIGRQLTAEQRMLLEQEKEMAPPWTQEYLDVVLSAGLAKEKERKASKQLPDLDSRLEQAIAESNRLRALDDANAKHSRVDSGLWLVARD